MKSAIERLVEMAGMYGVREALSDLRDPARAELGQLLGYAGHKADCRIGEPCREIGKMDFCEHPCDCGYSEFIARFGQGGE